MSLSVVQSTTRLVLFLTVADTGLTKDEIDVQLTSTTIKTTARGKVVMNGTFPAPVVVGPKSFGTQQVPGGSSVYVCLDKEKSGMWDQIFTTPDTKFGCTLVSKYQMVATNPSAREDDNELEFDAGDVIEVTDEDPSGWNYGVCNGFYGMFPGNFCKKLVEYIGECKVTVAYQKQEDNELDLKVGDIVKIISQDASGWWEGEVGGTTGWFPSNFVEPVNDQKEQPPSQPQSQPPQTPQPQIPQQSTQSQPPQTPQPQIPQSSPQQQQQQRPSPNSQGMPARPMPSSRPPNSGLQNQSAAKSPLPSSAGNRLHVARKAKGPAKRHSASRGKKLGEDVKTWTETDKAPGNQSGTSPASNARRMLNPMGGMADVTNQLKMQLGKKPNGPMPGRNSDSPHNGGAQPAGMPQRGMPQRGMPQRPMPQGKPSGSQQPSQMPPQQPIKLPQMPMPGQQQQQQQQQPIKLPMPQQGRGVQQHPMHAQHAANLPKNEQGLGNPPSSQGNKSVGIPHPSTPIPGRVDVSSGGRAAKSAGIPHPSTPMPGREQGKPSQPQQQPQQRAPSGLSQQQNEKYNRLLALLNEKVLTAKLEGPVAQEFKTIPRPVFAIRSTDGQHQFESGMQRIIIGEGIKLPLLAYLMKNGIQYKQTEFSLGTTEGVLLLVKEFFQSESQHEKTSDPFILVQGFHNFFTQACKTPVGVDLCVYERLKEVQTEVRGRAFAIGNRFPPLLLQPVLDCYFLLASFVLTPIALATFLCSCPQNVRAAFAPHSLVGESVSLSTRSGIVAFALPEASFVVCDSHLCTSQDQSAKTQKVLAIAETAIEIARC